MNMFCTKCGNQMPDDAVFCTSCGNKIEGTNNMNSSTNAEAVTNTQPVVNAQPVGQQFAAPKKKSKAPWIILGVSIALLVAIITTVIILLVACSDDNNDSPNSVITAFFDAVTDNDSEGLLELVYTPLTSKAMVQLGTREAVAAKLITSTTGGKTDIIFTSPVITKTTEASESVYKRYNSTLGKYGYTSADKVYIVTGTVNYFYSGGNGTKTFSAEIVCSDDEYFISNLSLK